MYLTKIDFLFIVVVNGKKNNDVKRFAHAYLSRQAGTDSCLATSSSKASAS